MGFPLHVSQRDLARFLHRLALAAFEEVMSDLLPSACKYLVLLLERPLAAPLSLRCHLWLRGLHFVSYRQETIRLITCKLVS